MKTWSKIPIVGVLVPLVGRNFGRSSANGCGISAWNSASTSLPQPCASPNLPRRTFPNQHPEPRLHPKLGRLYLWCMALRNGRANRLPAAFQDRHLRLNLMGRSSVLPIVLFIHKNADRSAMALTVCCMQLASEIVRRCAVRSACQASIDTTKPRRVSAVFWPATATQAGSSALVPALPEAPPKTPEPIPRLPVLWEDWPRCQLRRRWINLMRSQTVSLSRGAAPTADHMGATPPPIITRAERAHWRFTWDQRLARNARHTTAPPLTLTIHGLPATFAHVYGFGLLTAEEGGTNAA